MLQKCLPKRVSTEMSVYRCVFTDVSAYRCEISTEVNAPQKSTSTTRYLPFSKVAVVVAYTIPSVEVCSSPSSK